jgi:uncharacterized membrane protein YccC
VSGTSTALAGRRSSLARLLREAARLDRTQSDPVVAARNAIGVALPLVVGALAGSVASGLPSAVGALQTAFADRPGPYRLRILRMAVTALAAAVTSTLAVALSRNDIASALLVAVIAFGAGLLLSAGPSATQVGVAASAAALVLGHQAQRPGVAVHVGLLVLAGGLVQTLLAVAAWPLRRHQPERRALAALYRSLAALARSPVGTGEGPPLGDVLASVRSTLYGLGHDHGPSVEAYRVLLDEAERIRRELLALGGFVGRLERADAPDAANAVRQVLSEASRVLDAIATALERGQPIDTAVVAAARTDFDKQLEVLTATAAPAERTRRAAAVRVRGLAGQLRATVQSAAAGASEGSLGEEQIRVRGAQRLRDPLAAALANLRPDSAVLRHAVRLAVIVGGSDLVVRLAGVERGYWISLTAVVVLRPDFGSTFQRAATRVVGTIAGLLLATVLVHWVPGGEWYAIALIALFFFAMRFAGPGNLALSALALAALVVILLSLSGVSPHQSVWDRGLDTVIGGALALLAILLGTPWERDAVAARMAELLASYRAYTLAVANLDFDPPRLQRARAAARRARTEAQASVDRARSEPVSSRPQVELGEAVLAHTHRYIHAMLTIDALRPALRELGGLRELDELLQQAAAVLQSAETAIRSGTAPRSASLRPAQEALAAAVERNRARFGSADVAAALLDATDRIANSLDTLVSELRRQLAPADEALASEDR